MSQWLKIDSYNVPKILSPSSNLPLLAKTGCVSFCQKWKIGTTDLHTDGQCSAKWHSGLTWAEKPLQCTRYRHLALLYVAMRSITNFRLRQYIRFITAANDDVTYVSHGALRRTTPMCLYTQHKQRSHLVGVSAIWPLDGYTRWINTPGRDSHEPHCIHSTARFLCSKVTPNVKMYGDRV